MRIPTFSLPRSICRRAAPLLLTLALLPSSVAQGDGGLMPPYGSFLREPAQQALLLHDRASRLEELILQVSFHGDAREFAWIVPVPSLPELAPAEAALFTDLRRLTEPVRRDRGDGWGCASDDGQVYPTDAGRADVIIYDEQEVGVYYALTVGGNDAGALTDSLETWGYLHAANRAAVEEALEFYIRKEWYFVALRIQNAGGDGIPPAEYWYGLMEPIHLTFETREPVYPLRISGISAEEHSEILLYVATEHRMEFEGARTEYANWLSERELEYLAEQYPYLAAVLTRPCFLTKLSRIMSPAAMTDDLVLERAASDAEFREIRYSGIPISGLLLLGVAGLLISRGWRRRPPLDRNRGIG